MNDTSTSDRATHQSPDQLIQVRIIHITYVQVYMNTIISHQIEYSGVLHIGMNNEQTEMVENRSTEKRATQLTNSPANKFVFLWRTR